MEMVNEEGTKIESSRYNEGTTARQLIHEVINSTKNYDVIHKAFVMGRAKDIFDCEKAPIVDGEKLPCIIVGSGPSLNHSIEELRNWKGGIFCTTSHALSLIRYGIQPTHIVALDPFCTFDEIAGIDWSKTRTKLIAQPGVWPSLISNWPNDIILYLENIGQQNSFYNTIQKQMYSVREEMGKGIREPLFRYMVRTSFAMFACSPPLQLFVADKLGYGTAFTCGCDFAYPNGKERFDSWTLKKVNKMSPPFKEWEKYVDSPVTYYDLVDPNDYGKEGWVDLWEKHEWPLQEISKERMPMLTKNGIPSERIHVYYKKNFLTAWRLSGKTIYTTDHGAVTEIPFADIKKVVKKQGFGFPQQKDWFIRDITDKYLHTVGCYVIEAEDGKSFVEVKNPNPELRDYMFNLYQQYTCPACKGVFRIIDVSPAYEPMKATLNNLIEMNKKDPTKYSDIIVQLQKTLKEIEPDPTKIVNHEGQECPNCKKTMIKHVVNIDIDKNMKRFFKIVNSE